jgi:uncharacterized phage protein (TIGR01671 family)
MHEYIFRGKRIDNDEWAYGSLMAWEHEYEILVLDGPGEADKISVKPETVGQRTPRKDKRGNRIFEGDIVDGGKGEIFWDDKFCQFRVRWHDKSFKRIRGGNPDYRGGEMLFWNSEIAWEIIGNIHDNPDLLNPLKGGRIHSMNNNFEPKEGEKEEATQEQAPDTQATEEKEGAGALID